MTEPISFAIRAFAASKANSRRIVEIAGKLRSIKSKAALAFVRDCKVQCPKRADLPFTVPIRVFIKISYPNKRADLDESALLDALQTWMPPKGQPGAGFTGVWKNDRLIREKHVWHAVDAANPRVEVLVEEL